MLRDKAALRAAFGLVTVAAVTACSAPVEVAVGDVAARAAAAQVGLHGAAQDPGVTVDQLSVEAASPKTGPATGGQAVDPASDGSVTADRSVANGRVATDVVDAGGYQTIGVTWPASDPDGARLAPEVRTRTAGRWSAWTPLTTSDSAPDPGSADAAHARTGRAGTDSMWVGDVDAVQLSVDQQAVAATPDVRLAVVGSGDSAPAGATTVAGAIGAGLSSMVAGTAAMMPTAVAPAVVTRAQWGAVAPTCDMGTAPLVGAVLHHTADSNGYTTQAQAMALIRNDQTYHMQARGWCDLGYNFVVDKWGTIYEGRAGSLTSSVIGVHAGGFNTGTVGIAMLGTYGTVAPSAEVVRSVAQIIGWKLQPYGVDPTGTMSYYTGAGENSRYANQWVTLPRVMGHRDVAYTACPGDLGYAALPVIRQLARGYAGPMFISPSLSAASIPIGGSVSVTAPTISNISWTLRVTDDRTGVVMATSTGSATEAGGGVSASWNGSAPSGASVGPGPYRLTLSGTDSGNGQAANTWSGVVQVTGSQNPPTVAPVPLVGGLTFVPMTAVRVADTRWTAQSLGAGSRMDVQVAGVGGVPASARAVALNVTVVYPTAVTYLTAWPAGALQPGASILNASPGQTTAVATILGVGGEGKVSLYNNRGSMHVIVDVTGYYMTSGGLGYTPLASPARLYDSRASGGQAPGQTRTVQVTGVGGVPAGATAAVLNVVSARSSSGGFVSVVPAGSDPRATSTVNHRVGEDVANRATVALNNGKVDVYLEGGAAGIVVDVVGWYGPSGALKLTPMSPLRVADTRSGAPLGPGETRTFAIRDALTGAAGAQVAVMTLTATQQTAFATYVTVGAAGANLAATSDLNTGAGRDQATLAIVPWDSSGRVAAYNNRGSTHLVMDVTAVFG